MSFPQPKKLNGCKVFMLGLRRSMLVGITYDLSFEIQRLITERLRVLASSYDPDIIWML